MLIPGMLVSAAQLQVEIKDAANDLITVSGDAAASGRATLLIFNPGMEESMLAEGDFDTNSQVVQYFDSKQVQSGPVEFEVKMQSGGTGGVFHVVLKTEGNKQEKDFEFYPSGAKKSVISAINSAANAQELSAQLDQIMKTYSLYDFTLYAKGNKQKIAEALLSIRGSQTGGKFSEDVSVLYTSLRQACLLSAYNASSKDLIFENGRMLYRDIIGLDGVQEMKDYDESLNAEGVNLLHTRLMGQGFGTISALQDSFKEQIPYFVIKYYREMGFGHLDGFFEKYNSVYTKFGFQLSKLNEVSDKNNVYTKFMSAQAGNLRELAAAFNNAFESGAGGGGGGNGGNGGGSSSGGTSYTEQPTPTPTSAPKDGLFDDLGQVPWAEEAITALAEAGAINGKSDRTFVPNDLVSRAEFVKMLVGAFEIDTKDASCDFSDVSQGWSYPYIAAASSNGLVNGIGDGMFGPDQLIAREQGAAILYRTAAQFGIPLSPADGAVFADDSQISGYAREAVYSLKANGIVNGKEDNRFVPQNAMTRAEAAKLIYELWKLR